MIVCSVILSANKFVLESGAYQLIHDKCKQRRNHVDIMLRVAHLTLDACYEPRFICLLANSCKLSVLTLAVCSLTKPVLSGI